MKNLKINLTGWKSCDNNWYAQVYQQYGGSFCTHPRVLSYMESTYGVDIKYYFKGGDNTPVAAIFAINGSLDYKSLDLPFVFDDLILPIKNGAKILLPFHTKRLSPYSHHAVFNSIRHSFFKKQIAHVKENYSAKSVKKRRSELNRFISYGGKVLDVRSFSVSDLVSIYQHLFMLRWEGKVKCTSAEILTDVLTEFRDMIFGNVLLVDDQPCAFDINYQVDCPDWLYIEDFNGGIDPHFKSLGVGSVLLWNNILDAKTLARNAGKSLIFSLGAYNKSWEYKQQWCDITPSGRVLF